MWGAVVSAWRQQCDPFREIARPERTHQLALLAQSIVLVDFGGPRKPTSAGEAERVVVTGGADRELVAGSSMTE